jgi:hypothetical protein
MAILVLLRFIADIRWDINVNRVILIGFSSVRNANDPNELGLDVPESEALFYDELATWRRYRHVDGNRLDAGERRSGDFDLYSRGVVESACNRRDRYAVCVGDEPSRMDGKLLGERLCSSVKWIESGRQDVSQRRLRRMDALRSVLGKWECKGEG